MYKIHTICFRIKNKKLYILPRGVRMFRITLRTHRIKRASFKRTFSFCEAGTELPCEGHKWILTAVKEEVDKERGGKGKEESILTNEDTIRIIPR
jgi:hypothetical protein